MKLLLIGPTTPEERYISNINRVGGTIISFEDLVSTLQEKGHIHHNVISINRYGKRSYNFFYVVLRILTLIISADIIMLNAHRNGMLFVGLFLRIINLVFRKKLVLRMFGGDFDLFYESASPILKRLIRFILDGADLIILQTKHLVRYTKTCGLVNDANKVKWIPTCRRIKQQQNRSSCATNFFFAGHIRKDKGVETILKAAKLIKSDAKFYFFGRIEDDLLLPLIQSTPKCNYVGELTNSKLIAAITEMDALIFPSFYEGEGYPGIIIETLLLGKPVIASRWRAIPEIVGENGLLIDVDDHLQLASHIDALFANNDLYTQLSAQTFSIANMFISTHCVDTLIKEFDNLR